MTNKLEELANELKERCEGMSKIFIKTDESIVDIIIELEAEKKDCEIAHIRRNKENPEKYDFTYMGSVAQAYDNLMDNLMEERIKGSEQLTRLKNNFSRELEEIEDKKKKDKKTEFYPQLLILRDENKAYEDIRNTILFFADVFIDKVKKSGKTYGVEK